MHCSGTLQTLDARHAMMGGRWTGFYSAPELTLQGTRFIDRRSTKRESVAKIALRMHYIQR